MTFIMYASDKKCDDCCLSGGFNYINKTGEKYFEKIKKNQDLVSRIFSYFGLLFILYIVYDVIFILFAAIFGFAIGIILALFKFIVDLILNTSKINSDLFR